MSLLFRSTRTWFALAMGLLSAVPLSAQQQQKAFIVGASARLVAGGSTGQNGVIQAQDGNSAPGTYFYEAYPTLQMKLNGRRSDFESSYAWGLSRYENGTSPNSDSHGASARLTTSAGASWKFD